MAGLLPPVRDIGVLRDPVRPFVALLGLFALLLLFFGLVERLGLPSDYVPEAVLVAAAALFGLVALFAHGRRPADFYVADRGVRPALGGAAGASAMVGLVTIGLASGVFATASELLISAAGFLLGAVLLALVAPAIRLAGGTHFGDFLATRFGLAARLAGAAVAFAASLLVLVAVLKTAGPLVSALIGFTPDQGFAVAAALCALAVLPGGMRSLTWTQAAQYLLIAAACLAPLAVLLFGPEEGGTAFGAAGLTARLRELLQPIADAGGLEVAPPLILLAIGAASLPQMLARIGPAPSGRAASASMLWCFGAAAVLVALGLLLGQALVAPTDSIGPGADGDVLTRAMPLLVALPPMFIGLVMAGLLAALLAAGQAALFSVVTALSRDVWDEVVDRRGPAGRRILVARLLAIALAYLAARLAADWPVPAPALLGWALAAAAAGNFVPMMLGLAWPGCSRLGAVAGSAAGLAIVMVLFLLDSGLPPARQIGPAAQIGSLTAAALGMAGALLVSVAVSLFVPEPDTGEAAGRRREAPTGRERPA